MNSSFNSITKEEVGNALNFSLCIAQAVRGSGKRGIATGNLYAVCMDKCSLDYFSRCIAFLKQQGIVTEENHTLFPTALIS